MAILRYWHHTFSHLQNQTMLLRLDCARGDVTSFSEMEEGSVNNLRSCRKSRSKQHIHYHINSHDISSQTWVIIMLVPLLKLISNFSISSLNSELLRKDRSCKGVRDHFPLLANVLFDFRRPRPPHRASWNPGIGCWSTRWLAASMIGNQNS